MGFSLRWLPPVVHVSEEARDQAETSDAADQRID